MGKLNGRANRRLAVLASTADGHADLGLAGEVGIFSRSEIWVATGVIGALVLLVLIRDNRRALGAMAYVPFGSMLFERLIAETGIVGTAAVCFLARCKHAPTPTAAASV